MAWNEHWPGMKAGPSPCVGNAKLIQLSGLGGAGMAWKVHTATKTAACMQQGGIDSMHLRPTQFWQSAGTCSLEKEQRARVLALTCATAVHSGPALNLSALCVLSDL